MAAESWRLWVSELDAYYNPDGRSNFYSTINIDSNHFIDICFEKRYSHDFEYEGTIWIVTKNCKLVNSQYDASYCDECNKETSSLAKAKKIAFEMTNQLCHVCYDENGVRKRITEVYW